MFKLCLIIFIISVKISNGEQANEPIEFSREDALVSSTPSRLGIDSTSEDDLENVIATVEKVALFADKSYIEDVLPKDELEKLYEEMIGTLDNIIDLSSNVKYANKFINANGVTRIIVASIDIPFTQVRIRLLTLLKTLYDVAPTMTNTVTPVNVVDKLLDVYENDDNLGVKSLILDVLHKCLPGNPRIQARLMTMKGLEPFYHQIVKLDTNVIHNLLNLFRKILKEHLGVRYDKQIRNDMTSDALILYERIGLIEHLSTSAVCNGLLNIFQVTWTRSSEDHNILEPMFDLVVEINPFCIKYYRGKVTPKKLFTTLLNYVQDKDKMERFAKFNMNVTNIKEVLVDYVQSLKSPYSHQTKDEF